MKPFVALNSLLFAALVVSGNGSSNRHSSFTWIPTQHVCEEKQWSQVYQHL